MDLDTNGWQVDIIGRSSHVVVDEDSLPGRRILDTNTSYCEEELCYRAEVKTEQSRRLDMLPSNEGEYWFGFTLQIPEDWVYMNDEYSSGTPFRTYLFQVHGGDNMGRPPIIGLRNEGYRISVNICGNNESSSSSQECSYIGIGDVVVGEWENWVVYDKMSYSTDGVVKVWRNGNLVLERSNLRTSFNDVEPHYMKIGTYVPTWKKAVDPGEVDTTWSGCRVSSLKLGNASSSYDEVETSITDTVPGYYNPTSQPSEYLYSSENPTYSNGMLPSLHPNIQYSSTPNYEPSECPMAQPTVIPSAVIVNSSDKKDYFGGITNIVVAGLILMGSLFILILCSYGHHHYTANSGDEDHMLSLASEKPPVRARPIQNQPHRTQRPQAFYNNYFKPKSLVRLPTLSEAVELT